MPTITRLPEIIGPNGERRIRLTATGVDAADLIMIQVPRLGRIMRVKGKISANDFQPRLLAADDASITAFDTDEIASPLEAAAGDLDALLDVPYLLEQGRMWWHVRGTASDDAVELEILIRPSWGRDL